MVKTLSDLCFHNILNHSNEFEFNNVEKTLTRQQKEELLKRMTVRQQLVPDTLHFVKHVVFGANLRKIELHHSAYVQDHMLNSIAENSTNIEYLSILNCKNVTDKGLSNLLQMQAKLFFLRLQSLPLVIGNCLSQLNTVELQTLILRNMSKLQDCYVVKVVSNCQSVSYLDLQHCLEISDSSIIAVAAVLKDVLAVLKISGISKITDQSLEVLNANCVNLKKLKLYGCNRLSAEGIDTLLQTLHLESIDISYSCAYNGTQLAQFNSSEFLPTLQRFIACGVQIPSNVLVDMVIQCKNLTSLVLCGIQAIDDQTIEEITRVCGKNLKNLDLSYCRTLTDKGLGSIVKKCSQLERFTAQHYLGTGKPLTKYGDLSHREQCKYFTHLYLPGCPNFDSSLFHLVIPRMISLVELNVAGMKQIDDALLEMLGTYCKNLRYLNVKGCKKITDDGICSLVPHVKLTCLVISGIHNLTDRTIFMIANCLESCLNSLYISGCTLISPHVVRYLKDICVNGIFVQHRIPNAPHGRIMARNLDTGQFCRMNDTERVNAPPHFYNPTI